MLTSLGCPVYDSDAVSVRLLGDLHSYSFPIFAMQLTLSAIVVQQAVHRLYAPGGAAVAPVSSLFAGVLNTEGSAANVLALPDEYGT